MLSPKFVTLRRRLACSMTLALCLSFQSLRAQEANVERTAVDGLAIPMNLEGLAQRPVRLRSHTFLPAGNLAANLQRAKAEIPGQGDFHALVQFTILPDAPARQRLSDAGLYLLNYLPEKTFFARVSRTTAPAALQQDNVVWLGRIETKDKLPKRISDGQIGAWALRPGNTADLILTHFGDVAQQTVEQAVTALNGRVLDRAPKLRQLSVNLDVDLIPILAGVDFVQWIEEAAPPLTTLNDQSRSNMRVDSVQAPPFNLSGSGIMIGIWDGGLVDAHTDFGSRRTIGDNVPPDSHATHVAGTMLGAGTLSMSAGGASLPLQYRGMAPRADFVSFDFQGNTVTEHDIPINSQNIEISQNSWGFDVSGSLGNCDLHGDYPSLAANYDQLVTGLFGRGLTVNFAAGNNRNDTISTGGCMANGGPNFINYGNITPPGTAKDVITVGAINSDDSSMTTFSDWGPTDDGRLKPDLVAPGDQTGAANIFSTDLGNTYGGKQGTSMACPAVSGVTALLLEDYHAIFGSSNYPLPSTVKGLLMHTVEDLNDSALSFYNPGPDYASGYGRVQAPDAIAALRAEAFVEGSVTQGATSGFTVVVTPGTPTVKITLVWDDPAAAPNAAVTLINDLDLVVTDPAGARHFPWTLDPANPANPAVRTAEDHINNNEQVYVDSNVMPGVWQVDVRGQTVPNGPQNFSLIATPSFGEPPPPPGDTATLSIDDVSIEEPVAGIATAVFTVTLSTNLSTMASVDFTTADDIALAGFDYASQSGSLVFAPDVTSQTISINILSDAVNESNESFFVNLSNPVNATLTDDQGVGIIQPFGASQLAPIITSMNSYKGRVGDEIEIFGAYFSETAGENVVRFGAVTATVLVATPTRLRVVVPAGATYAPVTVTRLGRSAVAPLPFGVSFTSKGVLDAQSFDAPVNLPLAFAPGRIVAGDFDGDGRTDLAVTDPTNGKITLIKNSASGNTFSAAIFETRSQVDASIGIVGLVTEDIDGDGLLDLSVVDPNARAVLVFHNRSVPGSILFAPAVGFPVLASPSSVTIGHADNDGKPDIFVSDEISGLVSVLRNTSNFGTIDSSSFAPPLHYVSGTGPNHISLGDLNQDDRLDMVVVNGSSGPGGASVSVLLNLSNPSIEGNISFAPRENFTTGPLPASGHLADLDGDGRLDIVVSNEGGSSVRTFLNQSAMGVLAFTPKDLSAGISPRGLDVGDIDGDGKPDLAIANEGLDAASVSLNTTVSMMPVSFAQQQAVQTGTGPVQTLLVDINFDGKPDLVSLNGASVSVLRNLFRSVPDVTWITPTSLVFGQALTGSHFAVNVASGEDGTFIFLPPVGSIPSAGSGESAQELTATFIPDNILSTVIVRLTNKVDVLKADSIANWNPPLPIKFGAPLTSTQLNATANVPGTFVYTPSFDVILPVGTMNALTATFTPDDAASYNPDTVSVNLVVNPGEPDIVWNNPADIVVGAALGNTQLNATQADETIIGSFAYAPMAGIVLPAGDNQLLTVTFTPINTADYSPVTKQVTINVLKADPAIVWEQPPNPTFGETLTAGNHLNASVAEISGSITYSPDEMTTLSAGPLTITATFTPVDNANYNVVTATRQVTVLKANPVVMWNNPGDIFFGTALNNLDHLNATFAGYVPPKFHPLTSGGATEALIQITEVGTSGGSIEIRYQFYNSPHQMQVFYDGNLLFDTGIISNPPGGGGPGSTLDLFETIVYPSGDDNFIEIVMNPGGGAGITTWDFDAIFQPVIAGVATYFPAAGATLSAGDNQTLTVSFAPEDTENFNVTTQTAIINVLKRDPVITWMNPADIVFGTALNLTDHLNATGEVTVPGQFTYTPTLGTVLNAGLLQPLEVQFTPNDPANFNVVTTAVDINVTQADSVIGWNDPADTVYGTLLNTTNHLNATANTPGQFDYSPDVDAQLDAGAGQALSVTFTPDSPNFSIGMATATINVLKADPTITWSNPPAIQFGTALSGTQLNAIVDTLGTPVYTPPITTLLPRGNGQILTVDFTPSDTANFNNATATVTIDAVRADPIIIWNTQANAVFPYTLAANRLDAAVVGDLPGDFVYTPAEGALFDAGTHSLSVTFTPTSDDYNPVTKSISLIVDKAPTLIAWNDPDDIIFGTLLDDTQLNATSTLPGSFVYDPPTGALLNAENNKRLQVVFTPDDQMNYQASATAFADLNILKATPVLSWNNPASIPLGTALSAAQLNATANVPGQFSYNPDLGEVLLVGPSQLLTVSFTPDDQLNYNSEIGGVLITVDMGDPEIVWSNPGDIDFGTPLSGAELNAQSPVAGQFVYTPPLTTLLNAGPAQTLSVQFTPDNTADYNSVTRDVVINVRKIDPIVDWPEPSAIPYETPLGAQQLNATANVPGVFSYSPPTGAILDAGNGQMLHASFTPTDSLNYNTVQASTLINVTKLNPSLSWNAPASITFGDPLTGAQLNAVSDISGSFDYLPPASTVLNAGIGQPLQAQFTPTDAGNYESGLIGTTIDVLPAEPLVTWSNPGDIVFGQALKNEQLNATASIPGTFDYTPPLSTILDAGSGQPLDVTFTPNDTVNYTAATARVFINVLKADPVLSWQNPIDILFGTALSATQLNAMHDIPGSFAYTQPAGTVLNAGDNQTLTAVFTSNDPANFNGGTVTASINVGKANVSIAWNTPAPITFGDPLGSSQLNTTANTPGTFTYSPPAGSVLSAGNAQSLYVSFTPTDSQNYIAASATVTIDILQADSVITWSAPSDIVEGAPLTSAQLNATANVAGSFVYNPGLGAVLSVGDNQTLNATFTPSDSVNFAGASATVKIDVKSANLPPTVEIIDPIDGRAVLPLANLTITATAADDGSIAKVEFFEGGNKLGESTMPPYRAVFPAIPLGTYLLTAVATDDLGLTTTSATINIAAQAAPTSVEISPTTGQITVGLVGETGMVYRVEVSEDLMHWTFLDTFTGTGGVSSFQDSTIAAQVGSRFYRLVLLP
ncbi:MAG: hypothetical protein ACI8V5_000994 [Limisphaerales bacterium]|jgi:hypothetical protein